MPYSDNPHDIIHAAEALIERVQNELAAANEALRSQGIDPELVRTMAAKQLGEKQAQQAQEACRADLEAVEQEVREEAARLAFSSASPVRSKPPRNLV